MISVAYISIGLGFVVSLAFIEAFCLFGGGVIVPGYIALSLNQPVSMISTLVVSLLAFYAVKATGKVTLLYGRRKYIVLLFFAFIFGTLLNQGLQQWGIVLQNLEWLPKEQQEAYSVVGLVIPGLIAYWFERQGIVMTICTLICAASLVRLLLVVGLGTI